MKTAIIQPYIFPYLGYFQLIQAVNTFVFYDDVNFIKRGWINRNQLLVNNSAHLFSIPLKNASQNKLINEVELAIDDKWMNNFYATLEQNYKKAPYYKDTLNLIQQVFSTNSKTISDLSISSIITISKHIGITTVFKKSSISYSSSKGMEKSNRLIEITKRSNAKIYINPSGGKELYQKNYFKKQNIELSFIENKLSNYPQFNSDFIAGLSIIDVLMFNSKSEIIEQLNSYNLI
jgi:hypothetical protein